MVYVGAARKTVSFVVIAMVLSLGIMMLTTGSDGPTGRVTSTGTTAAPESITWAIFLLGVFVGAVIVGTYTYIVHIEAKRKE
jgi:uncharacterized membrane protein